MKTRSAFLSNRLSSSRTRVSIVPDFKLFNNTWAARGLKLLPTKLHLVPFKNLILEVRKSPLLGIGAAVWATFDADFRFRNPFSSPWTSSSWASFVPSCCFVRLGRPFVASASWASAFPSSSRRRRHLRTCPSSSSWAA